MTGFEVSIHLIQRLAVDVVDEAVGNQAKHSADEVHAGHEVTQVGRDLRGLVSAESTIALLDPTTNIITTAIRHVGSGVSGWHDVGNKGQKWAREALGLLQQSTRIPAELSEALHQVNKGRLKVNLEVMDSFQPLSLIDKMVNKMIVCIVAAALLIGSSLICTTEMTPRIFGIPALGFMGYIAAVLLGVWMLFHTHVKR